MHRSEHLVPATHPSLPGHFPDHPVVPGVVLLDYVVRALVHQLPGHTVSGVANVKFQRVLPPEQLFVIELDTPANGKLRFRCLVSEAELASGVLELAPTRP